MQELHFDQVLIKEKAIELLRSDQNGSGLQFDSDQMGTLPGWGDNDILRMAQLIPGVHSSNESASELHIRGGTPDQNFGAMGRDSYLSYGAFFWDVLGR